MSLLLKFSLGVRFSAEGFGIISIGDRIKSNRGKAEIIFDASSDLLKELFVVSPLSLSDVSFANILCSKWFADDNTDNERFSCNGLVIGWAGGRVSEKIEISDLIELSERKKIDWS